MTDKVIITCAVTGGGDTVDRSPAVPVTPEQIATASIEAARAGAAIAHIHVRDPKSGKPSLELEHYREVVDRIRSSDCDLIINLTTGPGARYVPGQDKPTDPGPGTSFETPEVRARHVVALRPEICSIDMGSLNFGRWVFVNTPPHIEQIATLIRGAGVKPELEVFEPGHMRLAQDMIDRGILEASSLFQLCLGIPWGAPATTETMSYMRNLLPPGAIWSGFGVAAAQFPMVAQAVILGGNVRVGLEDNLYLKRGVLAQSNAQLVEQAVRLIRLLGKEPAEVGEARAMLGLARPGQT